MATVIGRVTPELDRKRGPDVRLDLRVPPEWLRSGATVEIELPRNLTCAACDGGGCDVCGRSGAVTLRARGEPVELVELTLPRSAGPEGSGAVVLRIPDHGGLPEAGSDLPRGNLMLRIRTGAVADAGIARIRRSLPPPASAPPASVPIYSSQRPPEATPPWLLALLGGCVIAVLSLFWYVLRDLLR